jgi:phospholipase/carboxylesterase
VSIHEEQQVFSSGTSLEDADRAVVMLHGRGASARSMLRMADQLPEAAFLAPQAENRTWYPHSFMEPREKNQPHLDSALEKVDSVMDRVEEHVPREKIVVLGFSQGACLASEYVASHPDSYGGLVVLSGGLIGEEVRKFSGRIDSEVFIGCADSDPHIPVERVEETSETFQELGADVETHIFEGSHHGIVDYEIERMREIAGSL